jgi:hypothetical protein
MAATIGILNLWIIVFENSKAWQNLRIFRLELQ